MSPYSLSLSVQTITSQQKINHVTVAIEICVVPDVCLVCLEGERERGGRTSKKGM